MKRLNELETAVVKYWHITPENIIQKSGELNYDEVVAWCKQLGYNEIKDRIDLVQLLHAIRNKFWPEDPSDGFTNIELDEVGGWVLATYLKETELDTMSNEEIIKYLQSWKYYFGFRKYEGYGGYFRSIANDIFAGLLIQDPNDEEIYYINNWEEDDDE